MYHNGRNAEIVIARVYRGHLARRRCCRLREHDQLLKRECIFHYYALVIQKSLRGMHSRRTKLDFRIRKAYVTEIATKGEEMRRLLAENLRQQQLVSYHGYNRTRCFGDTDSYDVVIHPTGRAASG